MATATKTKYAPAPDLILANDVFYIDVNEKALAASPYQSRINFGDAELQDLADSIRANGLFQPIMARPIRNEHGKFLRHQIVFGERRVRATRLNGSNQIRATVRDLTDLEAANITLQENLKSKKLSDFEEAFGIQKLWEAYEQAGEVMSLERMRRLLKVGGEDGEQVDRSKNFVRNRLQLLKLDDELLEVAKKHRLVMSSLFEIAKVQDEDLRHECIVMVESGKSFRPIMAHIESWQATVKRAKESKRAPDASTHQRQIAFENNGTPNVSRGKQLKGNTATEARHNIEAALQTIEIKIETIEHWRGLLSETQMSTLAARLSKLGKRIGEL